MAAEKITRANDELLNVPNEPIIPFIIGDGIGPDTVSYTHLTLPTKA